jgi:hypothetical protein
MRVWEHALENSSRVRREPSHGSAGGDEPRRVHPVSNEGHDAPNRECDRHGVDERGPSELPGHDRHQRERSHVHAIQRSPGDG